MLSHDRVWAAIDTLAKINGMSPSGLARRAGLDPTTFNRSKRIAGDGRPRWPSTESISKVLEATGTAIGDFVMLMTPPAMKDRLGGTAAATPLLQTPGNGNGFDEDGLPASGRWDEVPFPGSREDGIFALEVSGNSMLPHYRDGDTIIVSPNSPIRRGDRVVVRTRAGDVAPWILYRRTTRTIELHPIGHERTKRVVPIDEIDWISRITWASQ
ncbi:phage repressor protein C with HTH and peptisase S24 domain [Breoghania corrubedonensis]|uniref:Phage repressor protein C with HTH and peptisase S24 domain n=1 Tax=Breoghania corrubedonensis TaxID=665038 RepID=A0A2T5VEE8_9HYPH|nr:helix-turn-helix transcriptional regulator [Breoghania corrubedonensis]PTW62124.1 phage repressor protein C with HTH and peptisase S24 domain [Breoghania corrubedonensis]